MAETGFYRAFEDRFRGTRESIEARLRVYLPFLAPVTEMTTAPRALDLGCGRGEWLELLQAQGFAARGVDLDAGMLAACRERELAVRQADALAALAETADESLAVVSGFHIAEHLPFETLQTLVTDALRVLAPGGLLILETPNPENILVASRHFYLDPTHHHPLPPPLLAFLPEFAGFRRTRILRLQEDARLRGDVPIGLQEVLGGASPDYAVVAQKDAAAKWLAPFDKAFATTSGVSFEDLAPRFDARLAAVENAAAAAHEAARQAGQTAREAHNALEAVYNSRSWRLTRPLRWAVHQWRQLRRKTLRTRLKRVVLSVMAQLVLFIDRRPALRYALLAGCDRLGLRGLLRRLYRRIQSSRTSNLPFEGSGVSPWQRRVMCRLEAARRPIGEDD